jgi:beta-N-acetylhexosaminidase
MFEDLLKLPLEKKIGQLFFIGISNTNLDEETKNLLVEISPGGVCLFTRNIRETSQTRHLLDDIRKSLPIEPFISLDQEGGTVDRLRKIISPMPAPNSIKTVEHAKNFGTLTAEVIRILGFNMNFAPVVDVINSDRKKFDNGLYSRTFGNSKNDVIEFAGEYLKKLQGGGSLGCLKHFPGLGASTIDSHEELPNVNLSRNELFENDLLPYQQLFQTSDIKFVMIAHANYPMFDLQETDKSGKLLPSSLSFNIVTKLLREELGFQGLAITDDLEMGAIVKNYRIGAACRMAIAAGVDMLAICANADSIREGFCAVLESVKEGEISESRIDTSLERIAHVKSSIEPPLPFDSERLQFLSKTISQQKFPEDK